jgi:hypothetical protein
MTTPVKIAHFCLANAMRDEAKCPYASRHLSMKDYICRCGADIVSIKELRTCKFDMTEYENSNVQTEPIVLSPHRIVQDFVNASGLQLASIGCTKLHETDGIPTYMPFYLAQIYNASKFVVVNAHTFHYYNAVFGSPVSKPHAGTAFLAVEYAPIIQGVPDMHKTFIVETCHFPLAETHKNAVCLWMVENELAELDRVFGNVKDKTIIRTGDFNTFRDKEDHKLQLKLLTTNGFVDVSQDKRNKQDFNEKVYGTFYPFPWDQTPIPIGSPTDKEAHSCLDYFFMKSNPGKAEAGICTVDMMTFENGKHKDTPMSDHFPISLEVVLY